MVEKAKKLRKREMIELQRAISMSKDQLEKEKNERLKKLDNLLKEKKQLDAWTKQHMRLRKLSGGWRKRIQRKSKANLEKLKSPGKVMHSLRSLVTPELVRRRTSKW